MDCMRTLFIVSACCTQYVWGVYNVTQAYSIAAAITTSYNTEHRPAEQTAVEITFGMFAITSLEFVNERLTLTGFVQAKWNDPQLTWTPSSYGGTDEIFMKSASIWVPPIMLANTAASHQIVHDIEDHLSLPIKVSYTGDVTFLAPTDFEAHCKYDITYYPFDSQSCPITISSWFYSTAELNMYANSEGSIDTEYYLINGEWELVDSTVRTQNVTYARNVMPQVTYMLYLQRRYSYYLMNMVLPVVILALLGSFVFYLPFESGEKIGYTLTILLSLSVMMTLVSDSIPKTSNSTCVISLYLLTTFIVCGIETVITVILLKLASKPKMKIKVSKGMQNFANKVLAPVSRYRRQAKNKKAGKSSGSSDDSDADMETPASTRPSTASVAHVNATPKTEKGQDKNVKYSFREIVVMFDHILFVFFLILTFLITFVFLLILGIGGENDR